MADNEVSKAASILGKIGGKKTAKLGSSHFSDLGKKGSEKRWTAYRSWKANQDVTKINENTVVNDNPS